MDSNPATPAFEVELSRTLKSRHVSMIAIGGIIGAGLFVGSSTAIAQIGPAVVFSYAIAGFIILLVALFGALYFGWTLAEGWWQAWFNKAA